MGPLGMQELLILLILPFVVILPIVLIYQHGKMKGRIEELERQMREKNKASQ